MRINVNTADQATSGFAPLPPGRYPVIISDMVDKTTKKGDGQYTQITFAVLDGPHAGRKLWHIFNFVNPSQRAVEIANDQFRQLCLAVGLQGVISDTGLVNGKSLGVEVYTRSGETTNTISRFLPFQHATVQQPAQQAVQQPVQQPAQQAVQQPVQQPQHAAAALADDDEIPF